MAIYKCLRRENIAVSTVVKTLTATNITKGVVYARIQPQANTIRVTQNGTDPNPATHVGEIILATHLPLYEVWGADNLNNFKMIRESADAYVEVTYFGTAEVS